MVHFEELSHNQSPTCQCYLLSPPPFFKFRSCLQHIKVYGPGVKSELQLPATATVMRGLNHFCDLYHNSWQHQTLNPPIKARDQTHIPMDTSPVLNPLSHNGNCLSPFQTHVFLLFPCATLWLKPHKQQPPQSPPCHQACASAICLPTATRVIFPTHKF